MKQDKHTELSDYISTTYDKKTKDNLNTKRGGANKTVSNLTEENPIFL